LDNLREAEDFGAAVRRLQHLHGVPRKSVETALFIALSAGALECT
jgi:hypothetical protein